MRSGRPVLAPIERDSGGVQRFDFVVQFAKPIVY